MYSLTETWHSKPYPFISPKRPELSAKGKNVVITGGGTGIGKAVGLAFAEAGAKSISILGRRLEVLKAAQADITAASPNTEVLSVVADLVDKDQTVAAFRSISEQVGKIDVLVSNVGVYQSPGLMSSYNAQGLMRSLELNVITTLHTCQAFLLVAGSDPTLLHTTSDMACMPAKPGWHGSGSYSVAKAAALKLIEYIAAENPHVRVISVQPGFIPTDLNGNHEAAPDLGELPVVFPQLFMLTAQVSLPGSFYVWLASSEAAFLKGKVVWSNWDAQELLRMADEAVGKLTWSIVGVPL